MTQKKKILFVCTGNSCRSQMAEGWARHLFGDTIEPHSAGVIASGMNPYVIGVMAEEGVDIAEQRSKTIRDVMDESFDLVMTLCSHADQRCPTFPKETQKIHIPFDDPLTLGNLAESEEERIEIYRRIRDQIRDWIVQNLLHYTLRV